MADSLNDLKAKYYRTLGYSGSIADMEYAFYKSNTGSTSASSSSDMQYAYYSNPPAVVPHDETGQ